MTSKLLLCFALLLTLGAIVMSVSGGSENDKHDSIIEGFFRLSQPNIFRAPDMDKLLTAMEAPPQPRKWISYTKKIEINIRKDKEANNMVYIIHILMGPLYFTVENIPFTFGKEFSEEQLNQKYKGIFTFEGNKLIKDEKFSNYTCHHVGTFTEEDLTVNLECKGVEAKLKLMRVY